MKQTLPILAVLTFLTPLAFPYASGPDPRHTAAPGDDQSSCASSGCHTGTAVNGGGGNIVVSFPNGATYTPGQQQTFTVTVTDAGRKFFGFQMSARLASNLSGGQAGDFQASAGQLVLCDNGLSKSSKGCAANALVQFIEHSTPSTSGVWQVTWTPPSTAVGDVVIYVAGVANTQSSVPSGAHVYTANYKLAAAAAGGPNPTISQSGIVSASSFNPKAGVSPGTWLEIYGSNISSVTGGWGGSDFNGNNAPTKLNGVSVTIGGKSAFVDYTSAGQVNVQVPDGIGAGLIPVVVTNANGSSSPVSVTAVSLAPALLAPGSFSVGGKQYVVAQFPDQTFVGPVGFIPGVTSRPAKAGETIIIYGIGFGPVTPTVASGTITTVQNTLATKANFLFGQTAATLSYSGLAPNYVGLYQFNVVVPNVGSGDLALNVDVGGTSTGQTLFITLQ